MMSNTKTLQLGFTIQLEPRTKKNAMEIHRRGNKQWIAPSARYKQYEAYACRLIPEDAKRKIDYPVNIKATYYMATKRRVDITNLHSALHDTLVTAGVIADDNYKIVVGTDGSRIKFDKDNPRTEVLIEAVDEDDNK